MEEIVKLLITQSESPILEFKKEWYWNNSTELNIKNTQWGEFLIRYSPMSRPKNHKIKIELG